MRRWWLPASLGVLLALLTYQAALIAAPRVIMSLAVRRIAAVGGLNRMFHAPLPGPGRRTVVRPSPDLAYSSCPFDLSKGPLLIEVAPVAAPYWSLSVFDDRTDVAFVRNNRDNRGAPIRIVLARPGQAIPAGTEAVRLRGDRGVALIRILLEDRSRFPLIDAARRPSFCRPLAP
ncbi:MAG TPA: DUF1254 domain-containing protein [Allosphingosinicella sp.]|nr:DUF1254 domain-containing protein [Allosphingosinicella sp.]